MEESTNIMRGPSEATKMIETEPVNTVKPRYANTDEMVAEFGDYRVNNETNTLSDSKVADDEEDNMASIVNPIS